GDDTLVVFAQDQVDAAAQVVQQYYTGTPEYRQEDEQRSQRQQESIPEGQHDRHSSPRASQPVALPFAIQRTWVDAELTCSLFQASGRRQAPPDVFRFQLFERSRSPDFHDWRWRRGDDLRR